MLTFNIIQYYKNGKRNIALFWDEDKILEKLKENSAPHIHGELEKAWQKVVNLFKNESVRVK